MWAVVPPQANGGHNFITQMFTDLSNNLSGWTRSDYLQVMGVVISGLVAACIYLLQRRLTDQQRVVRRLEVEARIGEKLDRSQREKHSSSVQLYNTKLLNKKYFAQNKRSLLWGYPFHAAELYAANFDGLEFVVGIEKWNGQKYQQVGVIPYEGILGIRPEGDSSFNGMIIYVKPRLLQRDKYSIAYKSYRYYPVQDAIRQVKKPLRRRFVDTLKKILLWLRYHLYYSWRHRLKR